MVGRRGGGGRGWVSSLILKCFQKYKKLLGKRLSSLHPQSRCSVLTPRSRPVKCSAFIFAWKSAVLFSLLAEHCFTSTCISKSPGLCCIKAWGGGGTPILVLTEMLIVTFRGLCWNYGSGKLSRCQEEKFSTLSQDCNFYTVYETWHVNICSFIK